MINKQLLKKRFNNHAKTYDAYADVQKSMANQLIDQLPTNFFNQKIAILEVGCGTGYLTQLLCKKFPKAAITAVDLSSGMIELAKKKIRENRVSFICGDIEELSIEKHYDLIISNATFQWFNSLHTTIKKLYKQLKPTGSLLFSTFGNRTFQELHSCYSHAKQKLGLFNNSSPGQSFFSLEELSQICKQALVPLREHPFKLSKMEKLEIQYFPTVQAFFTSIKKIGASNSNEESYCQRPSFFRQLINLYENNHRDENGVKVTYHCLMFNITKTNQ
ncbi:malonyl-ACP O-methyltransferase BioC [Priestia megaterium]|uniref:malonyl-ACP O-methyltransferase BioC n=1 Tax=Priestia megaterium TaxID=1404 RepID=UPI002B243A4F|nr:malonyl-ACP O-methyltransferase BioC [Priestia megaterium]MEB2291843.1 malonyl-ACP O-methyltransferase BioC [Priestia megaterium]MEE3894370.1 malonyl-ACP O-methyltransferase BioC [Priestia megaterium]